MTPAELLDDLGIRYVVGGEHHHVREGWLGLDCPWCNSIGKHHLGIPSAGGVAVCWRCGRHSLAEALHEITRLPWPECNRLAALTKSTRRPLADSVSRPEPVRRVTTPAGLKRLTQSYKRYLRRRGFVPEEIERLWDVRATGPVGPLSWRIWIPVYQDGELVTWTTRAITDRGTRYIHASPQQERQSIKSTLYGEDYCRRFAIVCEGPTDVWRIGPGAVATFGIGWSRAQALRLQQYTVRVICYDREMAAQRAAARLYRELKHSGETLVVKLDAADPGSAELSEIREKLLIRFGET